MPEQKKSRPLAEVGESTMDRDQAGVIDLDIEFEELLKHAVPIPPDLLKHCLELTKDVEVSYDEEIPDEFSI